MSPAIQSAQNLISLAQRLQHKDGELEAYEGRRIYPSRSFADAVGQLGVDLASAAVAFAAAAPGQAELATRLARSANTVSEHAGTLKNMSARASTFGQGWGAAMDEPINVINEAINVLLNG